MRILRPSTHTSHRSPLTVRRCFAQRLNALPYCHCRNREVHHMRARAVRLLYSLASYLSLSEPSIAPTCMEQIVPEATPVCVGNVSIDSPKVSQIYKRTDTPPRRPSRPSPLNTRSYSRSPRGIKLTNSIENLHLWAKGPRHRFPRSQKLLQKKRPCLPRRFFNQNRRSAESLAAPCQPATSMASRWNTARPSMLCSG
ncbi:hypothetical protein BV25DRAFT_1238794 [Artomyces pyxidatus]|uniref:Uncharacterized protein n=1 Tax=Artomyces pyxidatus TaxID=48021 RepID=A0ACB8SRW7_9AGAM|nr:hypothetical protein BV25DRAFT_1238794 [Artomyces pyxidatus]